jgi:hypothetical protein
MLLNKLVKISIGKKGLFKIPNYDRSASLTEKNNISGTQMTSL